MRRAFEPGERIAGEFGRAMQALHRRLGGRADEAGLLGDWATQAWRAADAGHVCVDVPDPDVRAALAASPLVGPGERVRPLVLDHGALYLHRLWSAEVSLARNVRALDVRAPLADDAALAAAIARVFDSGDAADAQQRALACALGRRLTVLTGGPGTGKTTTLARLLVVFARLVPAARIVFAAPTGKAAARLAQSLSAQLSVLDPSGALRACLPTAGLTVHRLLGARVDTRRAASLPLLDHDLVIVDEASMLDIELAARLFESIAPTSRLVLAGDRDQLASVEAGAVFADLCSASLGGVVVLGRNYRQQDAPDIGAFAASVREAAAATSTAATPATGATGPAAATAGPSGATPGIEWPPSIALADPVPAAIVDHALEAWRDALAAVARGAAPGEVLAALDRHRVLVAMRQGRVGTEALNDAIAMHVRRRCAAGSAATWYPGRLVMVTRNEPGLGLFNGDVGVCLPHPQREADGDLVVAFESGDGVRLFPVLQMPACEDAWAMTVHKAQGSEFESVALVPAPVGHSLNTRELAYTGITRARSRLAIWGSREAIEEAARSPTRRHGRLAERLGERPRGEGVG